MGNAMESMQQLAQATGLNPTVVQYINQTMGL